MKKKTVKILLHHDLTDSVETSHPQSSRNWFVSLVFGVLNLITDFTYWVGLSLVSIVKAPLHVVRSAHVPNFNQRSRKAVFNFTLLLLIAATPFFAFSLFSESWKLGEKVLGVSNEAFTDLSGAQTAIADQDYQLAQNNFTNALNKLQYLQSELDKSSALIQATSKLAPASINTNNLLTAATSLTEAGLTASEMLEQLNSLSFTAEGITTQNGQNSDEAIVILSQKSKILNSKLSKANSLLTPINTDLLPAEYQIPIKEAKVLLTDLSRQTEQLSDLCQLLTDIMLGSKSFLVILQNNNELRATGGFIGTIAQGKIENGVVSKLDIRTVYDLDGQISSVIKPPSPLQAVNSRLFLRDSNWFASFPESAQRISVMYEKSGGETPDLIFAFTPELFVEFLKLTGPITLPTYDVTISAENFVEQIQTSTSVAYNKDINQPKQLLADLYPALMQRMGELNNGQPMILLTMLQQQLSEKNILLYSRNPELQQKFSRYRWSGELSNSQVDYLHINSTNLSGTKTDRSLVRKAELITNIEASGRVRNQLTYTVENTLPNLDGLNNKSWVRFFVPLNSKLLGAGGFTKYQPPMLPEQSYEIMSEVALWEQKLKFDEATQMYIGEESGKTFFANWMEIAGGTKQTVSITYELPEQISWRVGNYQLLWEKQSGVVNFQSKQVITFPGRTLRWVNQSSEAKTEPEQIIIQKPLSKDHFTGIILSPK